MANSQSPQFSAVCDNTDAIVEAIVKCGPKTIVEFADRLKKYELVPENHVLADLESFSEQDRPRIYPKKVRGLMAPVQTRIRSNPSKYDDLLVVLTEQGLDSVVETMKEQCRELTLLVLTCLSLHYCILYSLLSIVLMQHVVRHLLQLQVLSQVHHLRRPVS